jgi:UDP-N-acetylmuramate dehydrogenase
VTDPSPSSALTPVPSVAASRQGRLTVADQEALIAALAGEGEVRIAEPLSRHTTLRIGGPADIWIAPTTTAAVQRLRATCSARGVPCTSLGAGSNLLVRDGGVLGLVLSSERLRRLEFQPLPSSGATDSTAPPLPQAAVYVEAGVATGKLLLEATRRELGGVEFLGGVPGSVGGGLIMNAGTYVGEFKDVVTAVDSVDGAGQLRRRTAAECAFVYRGSALPPDEFVVAGHLLLSGRARAEIEAAVRSLRDRRRAREPHGHPNAGSFFKNPPGDYAGRLIEACSLKGTQIGAAQVSPAHANWIVNVGRARASDVLALIELVRRTVEERFQICLELEVRVVGVDA